MEIGIVSEQWWLHKCKQAQISTTQLAGLFITGVHFLLPLTCVNTGDAPTLSPLLGSDLVTYYHQMSGFKMDIWKSLGGISGRLLFPQITQWLIPLGAIEPLIKSYYKDMVETWPVEGEYYIVNHV